MNQIEHLEHIRDEFNKIPDYMFYQGTAHIEEDLVDPDFNYEPVCVGCHLAIILDCTTIGNYFTGFGKQYVSYENGDVPFYDYELGLEKLAEVMGINYNNLRNRFVIAGGGRFPFGADDWVNDPKEVTTKVINERIKELQDESN